MTINKVKDIITRYIISHSFASAIFLHFLTCFLEWAKNKVYWYTTTILLLLIPKPNYESAQGDETPFMCNFYASKNINILGIKREAVNSIQNLL